MGIRAGLFLLFFSIFFGGSLILDSHAFLADIFLPPQKSNLELFLESDTVLMGNILSEETIAAEPGIGLGKTTFEIRVDRYLKNSLNDDIIHADADGLNFEVVPDGKYFELNTNVFLYLTWSDDKYIISPYSETFSENFTESLIPPPLQLFKHGLDSSEIPCKSFHEKIIKSAGDPICVKPSTAEILKNRGWGVSI